MNIFAMDSGGLWNDPECSFTVKVRYHLLIICPVHKPL